MSSNILTQAILKELFHYDPETGLFIWIKARKKVTVGNVAGFHDERGYIRICINQKWHRAHRLAFMHMTGSVPREIDHINHIKDDNRWVNLRAANRIINNRNSSLRKDNKSGVVGVSRQRRGKPWRVEIASKYIGCFDNIDDAIKAREDANIKYGFHENHGR